MRGNGNRRARSGGRGQGGGGGSGQGGGGMCVCPSCGEKIPHSRGVPCFEENCPKCGKSMCREGTTHADSDSQR